MHRFLQVFLILAAGSCACWLLVPNVSVAQESAANDPVFPRDIAADFLSIEPVTLTEDLYSAGLVHLADIAILIDDDKTLKGFTPSWIKPVWSLEINTDEAPVGRHLTLAKSGILSVIGNGYMRQYALDPADPNGAPEPVGDVRKLELPDTGDCEIDVINKPATGEDGSILMVVTPIVSAEACSDISKHLLLLSPDGAVTWARELEGTSFSAPVFGPDGQFVYVVGGHFGLQAFHRKNPEINAVIALPNQRQLSADTSIALQAPLVRSSSTKLQTIFVVANTQDGGLLNVIQNSALLATGSNTASGKPVLESRWKGHDVGWCGQWGQLTGATGPQGNIIAAYRPIEGNSLCGEGEKGQGGIVALKLPLKKKTDIPRAIRSDVELTLMPASVITHPGGVVFGRNHDGAQVIAVEIDESSQRVFNAPVIAQNKVTLNMSPENAVYVVDSVGSTRRASLLSTGLNGATLSGTQLRSGNSLVISETTLDNTAVRAVSAVRLRDGTILKTGTKITVSAPRP